MVDRSIALEALGALCTGNVTSVQEQSTQAGLSRANLDVGPRQNLTIKLLIPTVIDGDEKLVMSGAFLTQNLEIRLYSIFFRGDE